MGDIEHSLLPLRRRHHWPRVIFCVVISFGLFAQFALAAFSRAMGQSCNVLSVIQDTPWFAGASSMALLFFTIYWGAGVASIAIGYACSLHIINAGLINIVTHGAWGCYLSVDPDWIDVHPTATGWMLVAGGVLCMGTVWLLSTMTQRFERK